MRRLTPVLVALLAAVGAPLVTPGNAYAHADLAHSAPADGAVLDGAPSGLTLSFTESVELKATHVEIVDGDGRHWAPTSMALRRRGEAATADPEADTESPVEVVVGLPVLPANTYRVIWNTLSSDDLHTTEGDLVFGVQRQVRASVVPPPAGPAPLESALRALGLLGTAVLLGGAAMALLLAATRRPAGPAAGAEAALRRRLLGDAASGGLLALLAVPVLLVVQVAGARGDAGVLLGQELLDGRWLVREASLAVLAGIVWWARGPVGTARRLPGPWLALAGVLAFALAASTALLGHPSGGTAATVLTGGIHVLAAGGWAGAVVAAALALVPAGPAGQERMARGRLLLRAFAPLAVACLGALTVTGLLLAAAQVSTVDALLTTPYGLLLVAKTALVAVAGLLGLRTARRLRAGPPAPGVPRLRGGLAAEGAVLGVVLVLAAALAASAPARGPRFDSGPRLATAAESSGQVADLVDTVSVGPNRPGPNVVTVSVSQTRRPEPGPVVGVSVELRGPDGTARIYPLARGSDGRFSAPVPDIRTPGVWRVVVTVQRTGMPPVSDPHRWVVAGSAPTAAPVVFSTARIRPWAVVLAWLAVLAVLVVAGVAGYRDRSRWRDRAGRLRAALLRRAGRRGGRGEEVAVEGADPETAERRDLSTV